MSVKKVTLICSSTKWAGTENWTLRAAEGLQQAGLKVSLVLRNPELFQERMRVEVPVTRIRMRNDGDLASLTRLALHFRRHADVIIPTRVRDYWLAGLAARLTHTPNLLRLGVVRSLRDRHPMDLFRYGLLPKAILVNAQAIRDTLMQTSWIEPSEVHVIYNGVDTPGPGSKAERNGLRETGNVAPGDTLIVGAGRLAVEKRWDWLIRAAAQLSEEGHPVKVKLFGEGNERWNLEGLVRKLGQENNIELPGLSKEVTRWFDAADLVTLPSSNEGISNTMLEAMGRGTPVVATRSGGVEEHFEDEHHLLLADTADYEGFLQRVRRLAANPSFRRTIGDVGLERVRERFAWDRMTAHLIGLLNLVQEGRR
ncbi:glycosyltransferase family 4 protein [bacterium]|nr:glycosyltransferase family 4 protein [bacterium]